MTTTPQTTPLVAPGGILDDLLDEEDRTILRLASTPLTPPERRELMHLLGYPDPMPTSTQDRCAVALDVVLGRLIGRGALTTPAHHEQQVRAEAQRRLAHL